MTVPGRSRLLTVAVALAGAAGLAACGDDGAAGPGPDAATVTPTAAPTGEAGAPTTAPDADPVTPAPTADAPAATEPPDGSPPPPPPRPASAAGGACHLLDYPTLYEHLGLAFDVAAARSKDDAHACVVRTTTAPLPDLALTVVKTSADPEGFELDLMPEDAEEVERLGRIGYLAETSPEGDRGPGLEIGWLSADNRLLTVVLTLPEGADEDPADYADGLIEVARTVDRRRI
jgi:hypothetical protein